jgi:hypothetical protein
MNPPQAVCGIWERIIITNRVAPVVGDSSTLYDVNFDLDP